MLSSPSGSYVQRVLIAAGIVLALLALLYFFQLVARVLLLLFAAVLLAIFLSALAAFIHHRTPLSQGVSLALTVVGLFALAVGIGWVAGPRLGAQFGQLTERIPEALDQIRAMLAQYEWGLALLAQTPGSGQGVPFGSIDVVGRITGVFSTTLGILANVLIVGIIGLYLAIDPSLYIDNAVRLVPMSRRQRAREVFVSMGRALRWWLIGRIASMAIVGVLTVIGLLLIGMPLAFTLGFIAAIFSFVPYVGPIASAVPALLVAMVESPTMVLYVALLYLGVQLLESNAITPLIQQKVVSLPPALLLTAQTLVGVLAGLLGLLVAAPLAVAVIVIVQMLYVEDVLGDHVRVMGTHSSD